MKNVTMSRLGGFTLIELLVVVLIIGILAAIAVPQYTKAVEKARIAEAISTGRSLVNAIKVAQLANGGPVTWDMLDIEPPTSNTWEYTFWGGPVVEAAKGGLGGKKTQAIKVIKNLVPMGLKYSINCVEGVGPCEPDPSYDHLAGSLPGLISSGSGYAIYITEFGTQCMAATADYMDFCKEFNKTAK